MRKQPLWLVDDNRDTPFWRRDGAFRGIFEEKFEIFEVTNFRTSEDAAGKMLTAFANARFPSNVSHVIVSDMMFGEDHQGGVHLLEILDKPQSAFLWRRAVLYSTLASSRLNKSDKVLGVRRLGQLADARRILRFILDGKGDYFVDLERKVEALRPLAFLCDTLSRFESYEASSAFAPVASYGVMQPQSAPPCFFSLDRSRRSSLEALFEAQGAHLFSSDGENTFRNAVRHLHGADTVKENADWRVVLHALSPWETLLVQKEGVAASAIRLLCEAIQTGGEPSFMQQHPYLHGEFGAYERIWLRRRLQAFGTPIENLRAWPTLKRECRRFVDEFDILQGTINAARWAQGRLDAGAL